MTRKYTKRDTAYWSNKSKIKVVRNKNSNVIFEDKSKNFKIKIVADKGSKAVYRRKSV